MRGRGQRLTCARPGLFSTLLLSTNFTVLRRAATPVATERLLAASCFLPVNAYGHSPAGIAVSNPAGA
jgi:hypothetical protein